MNNDMLAIYRCWSEMRERIKLIDEGRSQEDELGVHTLLGEEYELMQRIAEKVPENPEEALCQAEVLWRLTKDYISDCCSEDMFERLREGLARMSGGRAEEAVA